MTHLRVAGAAYDDEDQHLLNNVAGINEFLHWLRTPRHQEARPFVAPAPGDGYP